MKKKLVLCMPMEQIVSSSFKLGIMAGGQLGKMLVQAASNWDMKTYVLDNDPECPAAPLATKYFEGSYADFDDVYRFGKQVDMLSYEIEHVNIEALRKLKSEGVIIHPDPEALAIIQDKGMQKLFYKENKLPTAEFSLYKSANEILAGIEAGRLNFPFVQKARRAGYDGKGVAVINSKQDIHKLLETDSVVEDAVSIKKELSVVVARNNKGEIKCFPLVEMEFNHDANLVELLSCPAKVDNSIEQEANALACQLIEAFNICGILAVELFLDKAGKLWINEVAPRPHNSGHHTIESCLTSQYEQHLRAILGFALGSTKLKMPAVMLNLLGDKDARGPVKYIGFTDSVAIEGVKIHIYGKRNTRPYRKMGHVTILADTVEEAVLKAEKVKKHFKVTAWEK